jgi:hypothetical protein
MAVAVLTAALLLLAAPGAGRLLPRWAVPLFEIASERAARFENRARKNPVVAHSNPHEFDSRPPDG